MNPDAPGGAEQWFQLGLTRLDLGLPEEAAKCFREALGREPRHARASVNLGMILQRTGRGEEAEQCYRAALDSDAGLAHAWFNLGTIYLDRDQPAAALEYLRGALRLDARNATWHSALGWALQQCGEAEAALASFRAALQLAPEVQTYASDMLQALNVAADVSAREIFEEHVRWSGRRGALQGQMAHDIEFAPDRPLRIGYVAPDFNDSEVACLIEPVLEHHHRDTFDVLCYSDVQVESDAAWRLREVASAWHATALMSNHQLAGLIREDRVDILVDLAGHGARGKRLALFEQRPAPIQVSWLGYPCTTGLKAMDYRVTDRELCPPGEESLSSERVLRLPESAWCFKPQADAPQPGPLSGVANGAVVFGSCRALTAMSNQSIALWARVLRALPESRFVFAARGARDSEGLLRERFRVHGIDPSRLEFWRPEGVPGAALGPYGRIDIVLDTSPASGIATTFESLWMGVPVVSLAGGTEASRSAAAILAMLGLRELVAETCDAYERIAVALATDRERLSQLRRELRSRLERSPAMDARRFAADLESLYRQMWRDRCAAAVAPAAPAPPRVASIPGRTPPRVIVDGVFFQDYATGIARVWRTLLAEWAKSGFAKNVLLLDRDGTAPRVAGLRMRAVPRHSYDRLDQDRTMLQEVCDEEHATVFVSTYFSMPLATPAVMMVHDMIPEVLEADLTEPCWREKAYCIGRAARFVTVSRSTARDLRRIHPAIAPERITVAHNGVDPLFRPAQTGEIEDFRRRHRLEKPYYLFVGSRPPYKNADALFRAFARLPDRAQYGVLCVGNVTSMSREESEACAGTDVRMLSLSDQDLRLAYGAAIALVFPSMYEGFGMPVSEAMACACPVITTSHSSLPEVAGDAGIYVNPLDHGSLSAAMIHVRRPELRARMVASGLARAGRFSWETMARTVAAVLSGAS